MNSILNAHAQLDLPLGLKSALSGDISEQSPSFSTQVDNITVKHKLDNENVGPGRNRYVTSYVSVLVDNEQVYHAEITYRRENTSIDRYCACEAYVIFDDILCDAYPTYAQICEDYGNDIEIGSHYNDPSYKYERFQIANAFPAREITDEILMMCLENGSGANIVLVCKYFAHFTHLYMLPVIKAGLSDCADVFRTKEFNVSFHNINIVGKVDHAKSFRRSFDADPCDYRSIELRVNNSYVYQVRIDDYESNQCNIDRACKNDHHDAYENLLRYVFPSYADKCHYLELDY